MARVWSMLLVMVVACLVAVNSVSAQEKKGKRDRPSPEKRFDDMEKAVKHDPLKGELTKDEFVTAMKETKSRMADKAEEFFKKIKKADESKVTKDEYVKALKDMFANRQKKGEKKQP